MAGVQMRGGADLRKLQKRMDVVKTAGFKRQLLKQLSVEALNQVAISFDKEQDPYGRRWLPLQHPSKRRRGGKILSDRGRLRNGFRASANSETFRIDNRVVYAARHNYGGSSSMAARTEMRRYAVLRGGQRRRIGLYSKRAKSVRTIAQYGASTTSTPARPFLPSAGKLGARWTLAFTQIATLVMARALAQKRTEKAGG